MDSPSDPQNPATYPAETQVQPAPFQYNPYWDMIEQRRIGRKQRMSEVRAVLKRFGAFCSLSLFAYLGAALIMFILISPEIMRQLNSGYSDYLFVITPEIVPIFRMDGAVLVLYVFLVVMAITASFSYIVLTSALPTLKETMTGATGRHSKMLTIGGLFFAAYFVTFINYLLVDAAGVSPNVPDFGSYPVWNQIYSSASAVFWEEIISRVLLIGVPLLWIDLLFRRRMLLPPRKYLLGGADRFGPAEIGLVVFSGMMFGLGHVWSWDIWKIMPTIIGGFCFGYLFIRFGLYASIMFHMCFNFLSVPTFFISEGQAFALDLFILFVWMPAGLMFIVYYLLKLKKFFFSPKKKLPAGDGVVT